MDILTAIVDKKRAHLHEAKMRIAINDIKSRIKDIEAARDFTNALKRTGSTINLIAEIKKASPSKGLIRKDFDHMAIASIYEKKPVSAISVLTEEDYFQGSLSFINEVKKITTKPLLRKDFIFDEYQIYEARANHADAVLLIAAILEKNQASEYLHIARELGLHVLFEIHDEEELEMSISLNAPIIGINNRNLKTMSIDLLTTIRLKKHIPSDRVIVSESGIRNRDDILMLQDAGIDAMLIGTSFMESQDIGKKIDELICTS